MDAATLTIDLDKRRCCYCSPSKIRCRSESCICFKQGRPCDSACESSNWTNDCLNKSITRCRCIRTYNSSRNPIFCHQDPTCPCYRFNESCTQSCGCRGECSNVITHESSGLIDYDHYPKLDRPLCGCSCSARGGCRKFKKCLCLQSLSYCGLGCKCKRECTNTKLRFELSKHARNSLFDPEECPSGSTAILQVIGANSGFQIEITTPNPAMIHAEEILSRVLTRALSVYTIPIQHVIVYVPNSPCFHQDCHPRCEIVDNCNCQRSCADVLAILYKQVQKLTRNTHMEMTVKFLNPYIGRGDLYTKRAILAMMESGIRVEPMTIKEWTELMRDSIHKMRKRSASTDRFFHGKNQEPTEATLTPKASAYYTLWNVADMDRFVRLSQYYINECRRTLGKPENYWTSAFHDLLKMTVLSCAGAGEKLKHISVHLRPPIAASSDSCDSSARDKRQSQMKRQSRLSLEETPNNGPTKASTMPTTSSAPSSVKKTQYRIRCHSGPVAYRNSKIRVADEMVESISKSVNEISVEDDFAVGTPTTATAEFSSGQQFDLINDDQPNASKTSLIIRTSDDKDSNHVFSMSTPTSTVSLQAPSAAMADKILMNLSGRNILESEQREIKIELINAIDSIQQQLNALMQYLDQKIASDPV